MAKETKNRYEQLIEKVFFDRYSKGIRIINFLRSDIVESAAVLKINLPKNIGDVLYSYRFRSPLPKSIIKTSNKDKEWLIKFKGRGIYCFSLEDKLEITPNINLTFSKILDSTPGIINKYSLSDEQALLAILRYNRLIDIFLGITCYSLQNHLRTSIPGLGQVETDEIYIGVDKKGSHYVIPIQAKGGKDKQGKVQIAQDFEICFNKFPNLIAAPVAAQFMPDGKIALFAFEMINDTIKISSERHYKLVDGVDLSDDEISQYNTRKN